MMVPEFFSLKGGHSKKTSLDKAFSKYVENISKNFNDEDQNRWDTYNVIIELLIEDGKSDYIKEIKYRITDGENPNQIFLDILEKESDNVCGHMWFFKRRLEEYLEDDFYRRFYE